MKSYAGLRARKGYELAFHFLKADMTAGSGHEPKWKLGEEREHQGRLVMCESGYHSSPSWLDAARYAPGPVACIVEIGGEIKRDTDKQVSQKRRLLRYKNIERELRLFACDCAERALKRERKAKREPDKRSREAVRVARLFAHGKATQKELSAAWGAAASAASSAAWGAAASAARSAAWGAEHKWQRAALDKRLRIALKGRAR